MNKTTLIFVCNNNEAITKVKQSFVEYFGTRMVADTCPDFPILRMNMVVDSLDMNSASTIIPDNMTVLVLTADESTDIVSQNYSYIQIN